MNYNWFYNYYCRENKCISLLSLSFIPPYPLSFCALYVLVLPFVSDSAIIHLLSHLVFCHVLSFIINSYTSKWKSNKLALVEIWGWCLSTTLYKNFYIETCYHNIVENKEQRRDKNKTIKSKLIWFAKNKVILPNDIKVLARVIMKLAEEMKIHVVVAKIYEN